MNPNNTLSQVANRVNGNVLSQHDYTYDNVGNRITHLELINGVTTPYKYVYDELNRLKEVRNNTTNALIEAYGYDPLGNRKTKTAGATTYYYCCAPYGFSGRGGRGERPVICLMPSPPRETLPMQTAKQDVKALLDHLPDDSTIEDIQYHLYVLEKIRRGRDDIRDGRHLTHEQAKKRLSRWLNPDLVARGAR